MNAAQNGSEAQAVTHWTQVPVYRVRVVSEVDSGVLSDSLLPEGYANGQAALWRALEAAQNLSGNIRSGLSQSDYATDAAEHVSPVTDLSDDRSGVTFWVGTESGEVCTYEFSIVIQSTAQWNAQYRSEQLKALGNPFAFALGRSVSEVVVQFCSDHGHGDYRGSEPHLIGRCPRCGAQTSQTPDPIQAATEYAQRLAQVTDDVFTVTMRLSDDSDGFERALEVAQALRSIADRIDQSYSDEMGPDASGLIYADRSSEHVGRWSVETLSRLTQTERGLA